MSTIRFISNQQELIPELNEFKTATVADVYDYFKEKKYIELDTETQGFDPWIDDVLTLQIGDYDRQFVIDITTVNIKQFKKLMELPGKTYLLQNAKFDLRFFLHNGIRVKNIYDTFLMECVLTTGYKNRDLALDDLAAKYANATLDKSVRGEIHKGLSTRVIKYAADDVKYLTKIMQGQMAHLVDYNFADRQDLHSKYTLAGLENRVVRVFADMEYTGVGVNPEKWKATSKEISKELNTQQEHLDSIVIGEPKLEKFVPKSKQGNLFGIKERTLKINYGSSQQKVSILNALGFNVDSSADRILQKLQEKHVFIKELRKLNKLNKLDSSFGMSMLEKAYHPITGRFHPSYWQILQTGRISVSEPNTNQIPSGGKFGPLIRSAFIPRKGYKIVGGDYSAMELREIAHFSQDPLWLEIFREGKDLHTVLCMETFNISEDKVRTPYPNNPSITYRDIQKTINYGLAYGMSEYKLADTMNCSVEEAKQVINDFFAKVPLVRQQLDKFGEFAKTNGYIITSPPYRRRRWFPGTQRAWKEQDTNRLGSVERAGKNTPIQGTNADITKLAMVEAYEYIERHNYPANMLLSVYDELQTEVREDLAEEWRAQLQTIMEDAAKIIITSVPVIAECEISDYWDH